MSRCEIQKNGTGYLLSGSIDETFGLATGALPVVGDTAFNLKGLKSINSTGIREWIKLMQKMKAVKNFFRSIFRKDKQVKIKTTSISSRYLS